MDQEVNINLISKKSSRKASISPSLSQSQKNTIQIYSYNNKSVTEPSKALLTPPKPVLRPLSARNNLAERVASAEVSLSKS
ncbi:hypothetical protein AYI69_g6418 [Smittium culicis]|uniref:Uncharacterized protein n=1 Tax=Smittium culicis TaxID=133412 RepID=A0A1R1XZE0_9FUNG|nr:hypothetical protein AYI69_g6418 [Smittium culicis]